MQSKHKSDSIIIIIAINLAVMLTLAFFLIQHIQHVTALPGHTSSLSYPRFLISSHLPVDKVVNALDDRSRMSSYMYNANDANWTITIVTVSNNGSFLPNATYSISAYPAKSGISNFTVKDDGPQDTNKVTRGILSISGLHQGNYLVTQLKAQEGYIPDKLSKIVQIGTNQNQSSATATFTNPVINQDQQKNSSEIRSITYTAKFECGSIFGNEGPLRPGHYDTDISIFNRQEYPINILLDVIINGGAKSNTVLKTIQPQTSTGIVCKDIRQVFDLGNNSKGLVEGFTVISLDVSGGLLNSISSIGGGGTVIPSLPITVNEINNFLDVQVFYSANALESLPHEILVKDIIFSILNDTSSKIPRTLLMKPLDITVQSQLNEISDPELKVRGILSEKYNLSGNDLVGLQIKIIDLSIGAAAMIDDHAISSSVVRPQASS
jgi:Prealbumin-like fold domain